MNMKEYESNFADEEIWDKMLIYAFQHSREALLLSDYRGKLLTANQTALQMLGYTLTELQKLNLNHVFQINQDLSAKISIPDLIHANEKSIFCLSKERLSFQVSVRMSSISTNKSVYALLFINNKEKRLIAGKTLQRRNAEITKLKELITQLRNQSERALRDRTQILQETVDSLVNVQKQLRVTLKKEIEANEKSSRFAYLISHEYRTPLTSILTSLNLIEKYGKTEHPLSPAQIMHLNKAKELIGQLVSVAEELLHLNTSVNGYHKPRISEVDLNAIIEEVCQYWQHINEHDIRLRTYIPQKLTIETNIDILKQVINNLISNAVKYSHEKGEVVIECGEEKSGCFISIRDFGRGIPKEEIHKLSNGFYRATNAKGVDGNGLGLFVARQFLEHLNGNLELESELEIGTCATIRLPKRYEEKSIAD
jgi:PAS domain S-box-containing protein